MLRPSRPMMRPFMSSAGSWTTETVVSAAWPAASRCMTTERMLRTRRSASRLVSSSIARTARGRLVADLVLELLQQHGLGLRGGQAGGALELAARRARGSRRSRPRARRPCCSRSVELGRARVERLLAGVQALLQPAGLGACGRRPPRRAWREPPPAAALDRPGRGREPWRALGQQPPPRPPGRPRGPGPPRPPRSRFPLPFPLPGAGPLLDLARAQSPVQAADRVEPGTSGGVRAGRRPRPPRQVAASVRWWVGCAGRARPGGALDRPQVSFSVAVVTDAAYVRTKVSICWQFQRP